MLFVLVILLCAYLGYKDKQEHPAQEAISNAKDKDSIISFVAIWLENVLVGFTKLCTFISTVVKFTRK